MIQKNKQKKTYICIVLLFYHKGMNRILRDALPGGVGSVKNLAVADIVYKNRVTYRQ